MLAFLLSVGVVHFFDFFVVCWSRWSHVFLISQVFQLKFADPLCRVLQVGHGNYGFFERWRFVELDVAQVVEQLEKLRRERGLPQLGLEHRSLPSCAKFVAWRSSQQARTQSPMQNWSSPEGPVAASTSMPSSQRVSTCSRRIRRQVSWLSCLTRPGGTTCLQLLGILLLLIANLSGSPVRWSTRLGKQCATMKKECAKDP